MSRKEMVVPTEYQIINHDGVPAFVLVPVDDFEAIRPLLERDRAKGNIPHSVVEAHILRGVPIIKAWREHLGMTQAEVADACSMAQAAIARLEKGASTPRHATLVKVAKGMGLSVEQLNI